VGEERGYGGGGERIVSDEDESSPYPSPSESLPSPSSSCMMFRMCSSDWNTEDRLVRVVHIDARLKRSRAATPSSSSSSCLIAANAFCTAKTSSSSSFSVTPIFLATFVVGGEGDEPALRLAIRSGVVGVTLGSLNQTTEETGRFLGLEEEELFCNLCDGEGEWRLSDAAMRLRDFSGFGVSGFRAGPGTSGMLVIDDAECEEVLALGGDRALIWSATPPIKGGGIGEGVRALRAMGAMRGTADEGSGMVKVSMTGLEGPMTWEILVMVARGALLCPLPCR